MFEIIFKIWYMIAILPFIIFLEGSEMFAEFLKKKKIYLDWDIWHSVVVLLIILLIVLLIIG